MPAQKLGLIGQAANRRQGKMERRYTKGIFGPAITELEVSLDTYKTNAPINEREGNLKQAKLEREYETSISAAVKELRKKRP